MLGVMARAGYSYGKKNNEKPHFNFLTLAVSKGFPPTYLPQVWQRSEQFIWIGEVPRSKIHVPYSSTEWVHAFWPFTIIIIHHGTHPQASELQVHTRYRFTTNQFISYHQYMPRPSLHAAPSSSHVIDVILIIVSLSCGQIDEALDS